MKFKNLLKLSILTPFLIGLVACGGNSETDKNAKISPEVVNNPATANKTGEDTQGMPVFTFEKDNHEFGEIIQGERVTYAFKFKNTGDAPLVISSASAS